MDWGGIAAVIVALGGGGTVTALYKWAKAQGRADVLAEQAVATIAAKDAEIAELRRRLADCEAETRRLWSLLETRREGPAPGRSP